MTTANRKDRPLTCPQSYLELREGLSRRDRSLRDKVISLEEAASFVRDGDLPGRHRRQHHVAHADGHRFGRSSAPAERD